MPVETTVEFPAADARNIFAAMERARRELGSSFKQSLAWGGMNILRSLSPQTPMAKNELRKVVQNPDPRWEHDRRRARFGVMGYRNGKPRFIPIYRTGEYGKLRFYDRDSVSWYERADGRESGKWRRIKKGASVEPALIVPTIMNHPKRKVPRRGLARKTWRAAASRMARGGTVKVMDVPQAASLRWSGGEHDPQVTITNNLKYVKKIMPANALQVAMNAGAQSMEYKMAHGLAKKMTRK